MTEDEQKDAPHKVGNLLDEVVLGFDRALKTLTGQVEASRPNPAGDEVDLVLEDDERAHAIGLMRVNHTGEICAQALYEGQALTARSDASRQALKNAAQEERDHLAWCRERLAELGGRSSILDPVFYGTSLMVGAATGLVGDKVSLGFVEATEDQVVEHLNRHLSELPEADVRSRAILEQMRLDEARHGDEALAMGGESFPALVKGAMTVVSRVMTKTTYKI
ncbi:MAG: 2-polyprenyl-3-methyl-6-methoxy-1,4-benzoquinone monooxygenase [Pseudomonadales bacterium]|nr:2-polyprenyl-3-methyl-6-methoxy-1,4-benzoquinone monooxygenase [Pseudomonadales bacterium]